MKIEESEGDKLAKLPLEFYLLVFSDAFKQMSKKYVEDAPSKPTICVYDWYLQQSLETQLFNLYHNPEDIEKEKKTLIELVDYFLDKHYTKKK